MNRGNHDESERTHPRRSVSSFLRTVSNRTWNTFLKTSKSQHVTPRSRRGEISTRSAHVSQTDRHLSAVQAEVFANLARYVPVYWHAGLVHQSAPTSLGEHGNVNVSARVGFGDAVQRRFHRAYEVLVREIPDGYDQVRK